MKRLLALLALCLPIYILAQGFGSFTHDQPYLAKDRVAGGGGEPGTNIVYSFTNLYRWWVASDVPTNVVVSNQWSDRIIGAKMDQMDLSVAPTNSPNGIYFNGAQYMTNVETFVDNGLPTMFLFVLQCENPPTAKWIWGGAEGPFTGFWLQNGRMDYGDGLGGTFAGNQTFPENVVVDYLFHTSQARFYTNGVLNKHVASTVNNGMKLDRLGWGYINTTFYYKGYIREILVWTNTVAGPLDSASLSNLHYYATNRYQFSP